jgi:hypothetical protein
VPIQNLGVQEFEIICQSGVDAEGHPNISRFTTFVQAWGSEKTFDKGCLAKWVDGPPQYIEDLSGIQLVALKASDSPNNGGSDALLSMVGLCSAVGMS